MMNNHNIAKIFPAHWNEIAKTKFIHYLMNVYNNLPPKKHPILNYNIHNSYKTYSSMCMENSIIKMPQMFESPPNFMNSSYMFDEIVDIYDDNREHSINLIRNMMKLVLEE